MRKGGRKARAQKRERFISSGTITIRSMNPTQVISFSMVRVLESRKKFFKQLRSKLDLLEDELVFK